MTRIDNGFLAVEVSPRGAETRSIRRGGQELLWQGDAAIWPGRAPILFPITGRAEGDLVAVRGRAARMTIHGFALHSDFTLTDQGADSCRHELVASDATRALYPGEFRLVVEHRLHGPALRVTASVENRGRAPMPFGFGFHPGFVWPLPGLTGQGHEITLENGAEPLAMLLDGGLIAGPRLPSPFLRGRMAVTDAAFAADSSIVIAEGAGSALRFGAGDGRGLRIGWRGLSHLVLWHPPGAGFLCIEPWQGLPARKGAGPEIADRPFALTLAPGARRDFALSVDTAALV